MPEDKDIVGLTEERMKELLEQLGKMPIGDPAREKIVEELQDYSRIVDDYEGRDLKRLDNNAKNDIEEARLEIDAQKIILEKSRIRTERFKVCTYILSGIGTAMLSYNMDKIHISCKPLAKLKDDFISKLGR